MVNDNSFDTTCYYFSIRKIKLLFEKELSISFMI